MPASNLRGVAHGGAIDVGDEAPEFQLPALIAGVKKTVRLSDYRGQSVLLAFYPSNWEEVSAAQLKRYQVERSRVLAKKAETIAICVDSIMNTTAWEREIGPFEFPICSDFWPHGLVCAQYGVLRETGPEAGSAARVIFLVDRNGQVGMRRTYGRDEIPQLADLFPLLASI